jgi:hypothetical protein
VELQAVAAAQQLQRAEDIPAILTDEKEMKLLWYYGSVG